MTKPDLDAKRWNLWEGDENEDKDVTEFEDDCIWKVRYLVCWKKACRMEMYFVEGNESNFS